MDIDQQVIDLATAMQRRHDFTAHVTGFAAGTVVLGSLNLADVRGARAGGCRGWSVGVYNPDLDPERCAARQIVKFLAQALGRDA